MITGQFDAVIPILCVTLAGLVVLLAEAFRGKDERMPIGGLAIIGLLGAGAASFLLWDSNAESFGAVTAELYPTGIRATAQGMTYNLGRIASAAAPWLVGDLAKTHGYPTALTAAAGTFLLAAVCWFWIPETKGQRITS